MEVATAGSDCYVKDWENREQGKKFGGKTVEPKLRPLGRDWWSAGLMSLRSEEGPFGAGVQNSAKEVLARWCWCLLRA